MSIYKEYIQNLDISSIDTWLRDNGLLQSVSIHNLVQSEFDYVTTADFKKSPSNI